MSFDVGKLKKKKKKGMKLPKNPVCLGGKLWLLLSFIAQ